MMLRWGHNRDTEAEHCPVSTDGKPYPPVPIRAPSLARCKTILPQHLESLGALHLVLLLVVFKR